MTSSNTSTSLTPERIRRIVSETPVLDIHTHIYDTNFGDLLFWGIDELLTYHYLVAEVYRVAPMKYDTFWSMSKKKQADYIWHHLFIERSPISEACRGILTCIRELGLDASERNLNKIRDYFKDMSPKKYIDIVFDKANVSSVIMTNDPFDDDERVIWERKIKRDKRFQAALRIDQLLVNWGGSVDKLQSWCYEVEERLGPHTLAEIRRFLTDWIDTMAPRYLAASLPPSFRYPEDSACGRIIDECILPVTRDRNIPFAMMIGVKKLVNPDLWLAGDSVGKGDIESLERLCASNSDNKFLVTMLSRENQHELCVTARKFPNLMIFGCWWFLNNPSIIDEMTRERIELLGLSMIPQHSDARVLDQLIYKWKHSRRIIGDVLIDKYTDLAHAGWIVTEKEVVRDVKLLFGGVFDEFTS